MLIFNFVCLLSVKNETIKRRTQFSGEDDLTGARKAACIRKKVCITLCRLHGYVY